MEQKKLDDFTKATEQSLKLMEQANDALKKMAVSLARLNETIRSLSKKARRLN